MAKSKYKKIKLVCKKCNKTTVFEIDFKDKNILKCPICEQKKKK